VEYNVVVTDRQQCFVNSLSQDRVIGDESNFAHRFDMACLVHIDSTHSRQPFGLNNICSWQRFSRIVERTTRLACFYHVVCSARVGCIMQSWPTYYGQLTLYCLYIGLRYVLRTIFIARLYLQVKDFELFSTIDQEPYAACLPKKMLHLQDLERILWILKQVNCEKLNCELSRSSFNNCSVLMHAS